MSVNLFFWIDGIDEAVPVEIGEPLGIETRLVYAPKANAQEFLLFYEINEDAQKWNKTVLGQWNSSDRILTTTKFTFPQTIPLNQNWRNSMVTWDLSSPVDVDKCYEQYKSNRGANFSDRTLYLIDLAQQILSKPISEALFDPNLNSEVIQIKKYETSIIDQDCEIANEQILEARISSLSLIPPEESIENFEFELLSLNYF